MITNEKSITDYLKNKAGQNKIDYDLILSNTEIFLNDYHDKPFVNFIITIRDRTNFSEIFYKNIIKAKEKFDKSVSFTVVEHSVAPKNMKFFTKQQVNYAFIPAKNDELFNKCLSYNIGTMIQPTPVYYLFHDLDILVKDTFFNDVFKNLQSSNALQCYTQRRVLNCDPNLTVKLLDGTINVEDLKEKYPGVNYPMYNGKPSLGSKGGSILIESKLFYEAGGYDPELFKAYSSEDNFFWEKIATLTDIKYSDNPAIEIFHMYHEPMFNKNPFLYEMENDYLLFKELNKDNRLDFINFKKQLLKQYAQ